MPGGAAGLQNQSGGRKIPRGFDSLPSPPDIFRPPPIYICKIRKNYFRVAIERGKICSRINSAFAEHWRSTRAEKAAEMSGLLERLPSALPNIGTLLELERNHERSWSGDSVARYAALFDTLVQNPRKRASRSITGRPRAPSSRDSRGSQPIGTLEFSRC